VIKDFSPDDIIFLWQDKSQQPGILWFDAQIISSFKVFTENHEISSRSVQHRMKSAEEKTFNARTSSKGTIIIKMRLP